MATAIVSTVILKDDRVLMIQEGKKDNFGLWNIPSGGIEPGENIVEAVKREAKEETGYDVNVLNLTGIYNFISQIGNHLVRFNYVSEIVSGELHFDGLEIINADWFTFNDVLKMDETKLWNGKSIKKIIKDVRSQRNFDIDIIQDVLE
ncbi:NUDIX hydrolase [Bacillus sp. EAC]|uniref:NUDIX hydrolase n=1 Tax=Bacillus sp. EAC TaxID=1978338 RepID=UPI0015C51A79|nr:NUDIX domain-containing protein [Bacillus sp. EAC]